MNKSLIVCALAGMVAAKDEANRVLSIPDMATFDNFGAFSGYLNVSDAKALHYLFFESKNAPETDPVLIWFNGGPGCSSMLGFAQEHGPYVMNSGTNYWIENEFSWNNEANVLYIEAPAGVGFSYCKGVKECNSYSDDETAADNLTAVLEWFNLFPEFQSNPLFISGESYAGIYVPYLSYYIDNYITANADNADVFKPNLKGFAVGNGVTNYKYDCTPAYVEMAYWHSLYNDELYEAFKSNNCDFSGTRLQNATPTCLNLLGQFEDLVSEVNVYDIFGICYGPEPNPQMYNAKKENVYTAADYTPFLQRSNRANMLPACTFGNPILDYLNRSDVRDALNIPSNIQAWDLCTESINIEYSRDPNGSQWIYEALAGKYRMLHYSGDVDGAVPTLGTENWINSLNWDVSENWRPYYLDGQVAGYLESYNNVALTFATVHGAGHMAPQFKRGETFHLVFNWINERSI
jgi:carboxypeptidase C (cathepsin A)